MQVCVEAHMVFHVLVHENVGCLLHEYNICRRALVSFKYDLRYAYFCRV